MNNRAWMVRSGSGGLYAQEFWEKEFVAIGWNIPNIASLKKPEDIEFAMREVKKSENEHKFSSAVGQVVRFALEFKRDDWVVTYDRERRLYYVGQITGPCEYKPEWIEDLPHIRRVKWSRQVERDKLTDSAKNSLGSLLTIFTVDSSVLAELLGVQSVPGDSQVKPNTTSLPIASEVLMGDVDSLRYDSEQRARDFIIDRIVRLDWRDMQELSAGLLRAMGFKTRVSREGADRGCDVLASPDGLGLSAPRIIVEVKHRPKQQIDAPLIRSFLGGRRPGDNGLYVSTGGFTKDARYEAERANIPLTLIDLDALVDLLIQHYPNLDADTRALVPLVPVYWPAT